MKKVHLSELALEIKKRNKANIDTLITELNPLILSMIKKYGYNDTFEENYQNSMVVLMESIEEYEPKKEVTFAAFYKLKLFWSYMIIIKEEADKMDFTEVTSTEQIPEEDVVTIDPHLEDIIWREDRSNLYEAINKLSKQQKWLIEEHYFKGKKLTDIAMEINMHPQSLVKLKARALMMLKCYLKKTYLN